MKNKEMKKFIAHCSLHFEQTDCNILHPIVDNGLHIDVLLYKPNTKFRFWKLVTMGASDYKMPAVKNTLGLYNEYMMFVDPDVDLSDADVLNWYYNKLLLVSTYAYYNKTHITYAHSLEWKNDDADDEMIAAFIELPQILENAAVLLCKTGWLKTVTCLQVVLLNQQELNKLMKIGPQEFSDLVYPGGDLKPHFICERHRSDKF